jgi:hypothetical protein
MSTTAPQSARLRWQSNAGGTTDLRFLQLARLNLYLAKAKFENPALRPDRKRSLLRQV